MYACLTTTTISKDSITIKVSLSEATSRKVRFYIYQCGKEDEEDLGLIEVKKQMKLGVATIDLEEIQNKSFEIALYVKEHDQNPVSNKLSFDFTVPNTDDIDEYVTVGNHNDGYNESEYTATYAESKYFDENDDVEEKKLDGESLEIEVYGIKCEGLCGRTRDFADVFICTHFDCEKDTNIYCSECMRYKHKHKIHKFDPTQKYMKCIEDHLQPNQPEFDKQKAKAAIIVKIGDVERFLWHHRWSMGVVSKCLGIGSIVGVSHAVNGVSTITAAVAAQGLVAGAVGGAGGAALALAIESIFIWRKKWKGKISTKEAVALTGISLASNTVAGLSFLGIIAIGAVCGVPGGPVGLGAGVTIAAIVAAILFGFGTRYGLNKWFENKFKSENEDEINKELKKRA
eukprot:153968_1